MRVVDEEDGDSSEDPLSMLDHVNVDMTHHLGGPPDPTATDDDPGLASMKRSDCFQCHAVDRKIIGPSYLEVANRYRGQAGALEAARERVDALFTQLPLSDSIWREGVGYSGLNIGDPVAYYGLRMLDQILALGDPYGAGQLRMTAVVAPCAEVRRPTLPDLAPETVNLDIAPEILADDAHILHTSTRLFRR